MGVTHGMMSVAIVCAGLMVVAVARAEQPMNILFLQCDQMDGRVLDVTHPLWEAVEMPALRSMAAEGVTFVNTYVESPLCVPSRATMWTGRRTHDIGAWSNSKGVPMQVENPSEPDNVCAEFYGAEMCREMGAAVQVNTTIKQSLEKAGYQSSLHGKMDVGGGSLNWSEDLWGTGFHGGVTWPYDTHQYLRPGDIVHSWDREANVSKPQFEPPVADINPDMRKEAKPRDWTTVENCIKFLENYKKGDKPFLLYCSVLNPHPPVDSNATWMAYVHPDKVNATFRPWIPMEEVHPAVRFQMRMVNTESEAEWNPDLSYYYTHTYLGQVYETDRMMGEVLAALSASEARNTTLSLFTSDHGEMHMEHRVIQKSSMFEGSSRVPLLFTGPGVPQGVIVKNLSSLLDIFPTLLDAAQAPVPSFLAGHSLAPFLGPQVQAAWRARGSPSRPADVVAQYHGALSNTGWFLIRKDQWKLVVFGTKPPFQDYHPMLFDVENDPWEQKNVYTDNPTVAQDLEARLRAVMDYEGADVACKTETKQAFLQWTHRFESTWRKLLKGSYFNFTDADTAGVERWLNGRA